MFKSPASSHLLAAASALLFLGSPFVSGQGTSPTDEPYSVSAHYLKTEYRIKMRDGVSLFTAVYTPRDTSKSYPFLVTRTCYSVAPYGAENYRAILGPSPDFERSGYIFVYQDVRGRFQSEGVFGKNTPHIDHPTGAQHDESTDMFDTTEWLLKNIPGNNGRVGIFGVSQPGFYTSASIIDGHPAIVAASPQAPVTDLHDNDDVYHNGAFMLEASNFYGLFRPQANPMFPVKYPPLPFQSADAYTAYKAQLEPLSKAREFLHNSYFSEQESHPNYDSYWDAHDISRHLHNIHASVLTVGGWFDAEDLSGPFKTFYAIGDLNPQVSNRLVIGPWAHNAWTALDGERLGDVHFGSKTAVYFREKIEFPFFEHYLKDVPMPDLAKVTVFETGTNVWKSYTAWPPPGSTSKMLYLAPGGGLSPAPPTAGQQGGAYDEYISDPNHPVPEVGYPAAPGPPYQYMDADQRFAAARPDVLVYQSEPLAEDMTLAGALRAKLYVSTSGTDSDFIVKLIDVYPADFAGDQDKSGPAHDLVDPPVLMGSYQQLVRGEPMRGKFREGFQSGIPFVPNKVEFLDFSLVQVNHTFLKGHRIMVQIQSTWFPLVDLNPQTFVDIPDAKPEDFKAATIRIFHNSAQPSGIQFQSLR